MVIKLTGAQAQEQGIADAKRLPGPSQNGFSFSPKDLTIDMDRMAEDYNEEQMGDIRTSLKATTVEVGGKEQNLFELNTMAPEPKLRKEVESVTNPPSKKLSNGDTGSDRTAQPPHIRKAFESVTKPLRKKFSYGDQVAFIDGKLPIIGEFAGPDNGEGLLVRTATRGEFRVKREDLRHPQGFRGARED
jgi:hypothetical protein